MAEDLAGRVAVVTGGASGIGRAAALALAARGARVLVTDLREDGAHATAERIRAGGGEAAALRVDVTDAAGPPAMVRAALAAWGGLHLAVNSAGTGAGPAPVAQCAEEAWERVLAVNLTGVWRCMKHQIAAMEAGGGGAIVNVASAAGLVGFPNFAAYSASKHGVIGLTRTAALEYAERGVRVNVVCPSFVHTPMLEALVGGSPEVEARLRAMVPMGRFGTPEEVAESIAYLCSDAAAFVTGHAMVLDGGLTAG